MSRKLLSSKGRQNVINIGLDIEYIFLISRLCWLDIDFKISYVHFKRGPSPGLGFARNIDHIIEIFMFIC